MLATCKNWRLCDPNTSRTRPQPRPIPKVSPTPGEPTSKSQHHPRILRARGLAEGGKSLPSIHSEPFPSRDSPSLYHVYLTKVEPLHPHNQNWTEQLRFAHKMDYPAALSLPLTVCRVRLAQQVLRTWVDFLQQDGTRTTDFARLGQPAYLVNLVCPREG